MPSRSLLPVAVLACAAAALTCAKESPSAPVADGSVVVTVTAQPSAILPGQSFTANYVVDPPAGRTLDQVSLSLSGLLVYAETLHVGTAGRFSVARTYQVPKLAGIGVISVHATAIAGRSLGEGGTQVAVADTIAPVITSFTVAPNASAVQPSDSLTFQLTAHDNAGIRATVFRISGGLNVTDSIADSGQYVLQQMAGLRVPRSAPLGQQITIVGKVYDIAGNASVSAPWTYRLVDTTPPSVSGTALNSRGTTGFAPGDTVHITITAHDNLKVARYGFAVSGPVTLADSFVVADTSATHQINVVVDSTWTGISTLTGFAVDSVGNRSQASLGTITVANRTRRPVVSAALDATVRDIAVDQRRGLVYVSEPDSDRVVVIAESSAAVQAPFTFPAGSRPQGLDLSLSGDSLLVALRRTNYLDVVNLVTRAEDTVRVNSSSFLNRGPDNVRVASNGKALVTITFDGSGFGGSLVALDLATRAVTTLATVTEVVPLCRSGDKTKVLVIIDDSCCPLAAMVYDAFANALGPQRGTVSWYFVFGSADYGATRFLVDGTLFDASLTSLFTITPAGYNNGASVITPDGSYGYFATAAGVVKALLSSGQIVESYTLDGQPYRLFLTPDGLTLVAVTAAHAYVIDQW